MMRKLFIEMMGNGEGGMMMVAQSASAAAAAAASATRSPAERPAAPSDPGVVVGAAVALSSRFFVKTASKTAAFSPSSVRPT